MPLPMVVATAVPKTKAAMKFQKAAHRTARKGVRTRVETTVAMELAAPCQPLENSKASVRTITGIRSEKLGIAYQALLMMTASMTLATSSHLSTAVSMTSKISFHLIIWTESF